MGQADRSAALAANKRVSMEDRFWIRTSAIAEIVSSVAVLATLIYLAIQIRQNTEAIHSQSRQALLTSAQSELFLRVQYPEMDMALTKSEIPSEKEQLMINSWLVGMLRARQFSWLQYNAGIIDRAQWDTEIVVISNILSTPRARDWWKKVGRVSFAEDFVAFVDDLLMDRPATLGHWQTLGNWAER